MRKLLWNFSVIWTNCILACVKKDIIDAIEILEEEIDLVQGTFTNISFRIMHILSGDRLFLSKNIFGEVW